MKRWHLPTLEPSSDKRVAREPGADAPRVPSPGAQKPRVLFSSPQCRLVALDRAPENSWPTTTCASVQSCKSVSGRVAIDAAGESLGMRNRNPQ